jgi:hypothetical protein
MRLSAAARPLATAGWRSLKARASRSWSRPPAHARRQTLRTPAMPYVIIIILDIFSYLKEDWHISVCMCVRHHKVYTRPF